MTTWETKSINYYYTVASSDFVAYQGLVPYVPAADGNEVLTRNHNDGLYMHELAAYYASTHGWNWTTAANMIDWDRINDWVTHAKTLHKKVVWSEPAEGWAAIEANPTGHAYLLAWGDTLVPTFATNFSHTPSNHIPTARNGAIAAAQTNGSALGESVQSWYWADPGWSFTAADAATLCRYGFVSGASVYQIEGTYSDLAPTSTYMQGVNSFVSGLVPPVQPIQQSTAVQLP